MYYIPSLKAPCYILRLSLWLLLGCNECSNHLYAYQHNSIGATILRAFGEKNAYYRQYIHAYITGDVEGGIEILNLVQRGLIVNPSKGAKARLKAIKELLDEKNADKIYQWACADYLTSSELAQYLQTYVQELLGQCKLLPDLPTNDDMLAAYFEGLPAVLSNSLADLKHRWGDTISQTSGLPFLQKIVLIGMQRALRKQVAGIKELLDSHPYLVAQTAPATYRKIDASLKHIAPEMEQFLMHTISFQQKPSEKWDPGSLAYQAWSKAFLLSQAIQEIYEMSVDNIPVSRKPMEKIMNDLRAYLVMAYKEPSPHHLKKAPMPPGAQSPPGHPISPTGRPANNPGLVAALLAFFFSQYQSLGSFFEAKGFIKRRLIPYHSLDPKKGKKPSPTIPSAKKNIYLTPKGKVSGAMVLSLAAAAGYQCYKKCFAKKNKQIATADDPARSRNQSLFFILCLLLGGLLLVATLARKKAPLA